MAVLGAKRPQDRGWQFIVLSLLVVLWLPTLEALLRRPQVGLQLHGARQWFLAILIALGVFNWLPTRYWLASLAVTTAQLMMLAPFLPVLAGYRDAWPLVEPAVSLCVSSLVTIAVLQVALGVPRPRPSPHGMDCWWLAFRDAFGAVWALRVLERINAASAMYRWPVRLSWNGFIRQSRVAGEQSPPPGMPPAMERTFRMLLRRFVGPEWFAARQERAPAQQKSPGDSPGL
jgi:hypothetical protein